MNIEKLIFEGATIIDVRTPGEFMAANAPGSINIPLNEVPQRIDEFRKAEKPLVLCCLSGGRSGQACNYLDSMGIECFNGGSWMDVNAVLARKAS